MHVGIYCQMHAKIHAGAHAKTHAKMHAEHATYKKHTLHTC